MKKIIALLLVLATVGTMLVACGNGDKETTAADNGTTTTTANNGTTTTTIDSNATTTTEGAADQATTTDGTLPTTDPASETTATSKEADETTTTVGETTTSTPDEPAEIFDSAWGKWDTYDINTGKRYTANVFLQNKITLTYTTTVTCSICKAFIKSYMNQLSDELEKRGGEVIVVLIFASEHYNEEKIAEIIVTYKEWYKANGCEFTFIVADDLIQTRRPSGVPYINIWVGGKFGGAMKMQVHGASGGSAQSEQYKTLLDACDFWLSQM